MFSLRRYYAAEYILAEALLRLLSLTLTNTLVGPRRFVYRARTPHLNWLVTLKNSIVLRSKSTLVSPGTGGTLLMLATTVVALATFFARPVASLFSCITAEGISVSWLLIAASRNTAKTSGPARPARLLGVEATALVVSFLIGPSARLDTRPAYVSPTSEVNEAAQTSDRPSTRLTGA